MEPKGSVIDVTGPLGKLSQATRWGLTVKIREESGDRREDGAAGEKEALSTAWRARSSITPSWRDAGL